MPLPDTEREDGMNDFEGSGKTDIDRIQCCSIVNSYVMEIRNGADPDLIKKQLKEGQSLERLRGYRGIIEEKIDVYNDSIGSPQLSSDKRKEYENKVKALELLRDEIDMILKDSENPDDTPGK